MSSREWVYDWKYGSADAQLKAKVLFINLFENSKEHHLLRKLPARIQFNTKAVQLDHMEAEEPDTAAKENILNHVTHMRQERCM